MLLPRSFYARDARTVAPALLGQEIRRGGVRLRITEVEAYPVGDTACHAHRGRTERSAVMFGPPGRAYVYLCYGIHHMFNVVTDAPERPSAVLIRACEPLAGLDRIRARRGDRDGPALLTGPGKIGQALALDVDLTGQRLYRAGDLTIHRGEAPAAIRRGPRIGIDYAAPADRDAPWRYAIAGTRWVSRPRGLGPPEDEGRAPADDAAERAGRRTTFTPGRARRSRPPSPR